MSTSVSILAGYAILVPIENVPIFLKKKSKKFLIFTLHGKEERWRWRNLWRWGIKFKKSWNIRIWLDVKNGKTHGSIYFSIIFLRYLNKYFLRSNFLIQSYKFLKNFKTVFIFIILLHNILNKNHQFVHGHDVLSLVFNMNQILEHLITWVITAKSQALEVYFLTSLRVVIFLQSKQLNHILIIILESCLKKKFIVVPHVGIVQFILKIPEIVDKETIIFVHWLHYQITKKRCILNGSFCVLL